MREYPGGPLGLDRWWDGLLRVVTIIANVSITIVDRQRQRGSLLDDRSVPPSHKGNGTVPLSRSAETVPTSRRVAKLASFPVTLNAQWTQLLGRGAS
jgi:hypothetical protein